MYERNQHHDSPTDVCVYALIADLGARLDYYGIFPTAGVEFQTNACVHMLRMHVSICSVDLGAWLDDGKFPAAGVEFHNGIPQVRLHVSAFDHHLVRMPAGVGFALSTDLYMIYICIYIYIYIYIYMYVYIYTYLDMYI